MADSSQSQLLGNHNIPHPLTSFVGRVQAVRELTILVPERPLVTLVGAPGCGKTRLACEVGRRLVRRFGAGVWFVELASLDDARGIDDLVARVLAVPDDTSSHLRHRVADHIQNRQLLLMLDNCEHVREEAAALAVNLLTVCGNLRIVATSRQRLGLAAETVWAVAPLSTPPLSVRLQALRQFEATKLWLERVQNVHPQSRVSAEDCQPLASLVRRLDGMPLAIELVAGWSGIVSPKEIDQSLAGGADYLLTDRYAAEGLRHRSLRAAIGWSCSRLTSAERDLFRVFGVFRSACKADAVAHAAGLDESQVPMTIAGLVDKSLLVATPAADGQTRYGMLQTLQQFARDELHRSRRFSVVARRYVDYYGRLIERVAAGAGFSTGEHDVARLDAEYPNVTGALDLAFGRNKAAGARMVVGLCPYWDYRGRNDEGTHWLEATLASDVADAATKSRCLGWLAALSIGRPNVVGTPQEACDQAMRLAVETGDDQLIAESWHKQAFVSDHAGDLDRAKHAAEQAVRIVSRLHDKMLKARCHYRLGRVTFLRGEVEDSYPHLQAGLEMARGVGLTQIEGLVEITLGQLELRRRNYAEAHDWLMRGLGCHAALHPRQLAALIETLAAVEAAWSRGDRAVALLGAADRIRTDFSLWGVATTRRFIPDLETLLAGRSNKRAYAMGRKMRLEAVIDYARGRRERSSMRGADREGRIASLSRRELEVARLVAEGLTNRLIADRLGIAERTAEGHVERIRRNLGVHSRAEIASRVSIALAASENGEAEQDENAILESVPWLPSPPLPKPRRPTE